MRVLIADHESVTRPLERLLQSRGYEAVTAPDGERAWRALSGDDAPGLAILDWQSGGLSVCRKLRERRDGPYVYVILLSARGEAGSPVEALCAGADDFMRKPLEVLELEARLGAGRRILGLQQRLLDAQEALRMQAERDALTGIRNRRGILADLERELARAARGKTGLGLGVLLADLDHFKRVNDTHGHLVGDEVLRGVVQRISRQVRRYDSLGRLGGEEFLILLADCQPDQVLIAAERIRGLVAGTTFDSAGGPLAVTLSLGAAWIPSGRQMPSRQVLDAADRALYAAKCEGRNRSCFDGGSLTVAPQASAIVERRRKVS